MYSARRKISDRESCPHCGRDEASSEHKIDLICAAQEKKTEPPFFALSARFSCASWSTRTAWDQPIGSLRNRGEQRTPGPCSSSNSGTSSDITKSFTYNRAGQIHTATTSNDAYSWDRMPTGDIHRDYDVNGLNQYIEMVLGDLSKEMRTKIKTLITIEVHARDVVQRLVLDKVASAGAFAWQQGYSTALKDATVTQRFRTDAPLVTWRNK